ncbi:MAG: hypothetical protein A2527_09050 [Candidatus Lambdaproteobacteria bacterium RIFOXYD2_FULL_50_16]|uniref:Uncharacterized protein n=1 Tax=Candidatus Lambdaproteobacteria bacterium RIFOXYD2_FULL_50_16 TaxID=1817772 RepID=A0A1F6GGL0_9PROT|nr:MAG: hypothetical protein A2527_09050 [Candidatus Lambdaproteobacteria bacterium RIFOXYD2_FULL_50_16]
MLGQDTFIRFEDTEAIIDGIEAGIRPYLFAEPAIRLVLDTPLANSEKVVLSIPCISDQDRIIKNFAAAIYTSIMGYYYSADPHSSHFGISNLILEGKLNSMLRREMEKHFSQTGKRPDLAARVLKGVGLNTESPVPPAGKSFLVDTLKKGLNIYVGYRIHAQGEMINHAQMFLPMTGGEEIIQLVYYNLEQIINQNFLAYDESGEGYLNISETLIFKELESILQRSRLKENTRKKILNNIQFNTVFTPDPRQTIGPKAGDSLYDVLNKVQDEKLKSATAYSSNLYAAVMVKTAEMTHMNNPDLGKFNSDILIQKADTKGTSSKKSEEKVAKTAEVEEVLVPEPPGTVRVPSPDEGEAKKAKAEKSKKKVEIKEEEMAELKKK